MSQRLRLIEQLLLPNANVSEICQRLNISRKTAYKWLTRYRASGLTALEDMSKAPYQQPGKIPPDLERHIVNAHKEHPYWGPRKIRDYLLHTQGLSEVPTHTTCSRALKRNGCTVITNNKSKPATIRFERSAPNALWQMDFKGSFMTGQHRCHPLTILDDYSRFSIALKACNDETKKTVQEQLIIV
ncbi:MAG: helix-turn-helix domain-containing protein, partial [Pseudomonadota bacterium]|nr:helix-turn-helix domain-containing protein [Pseudomonadota bacterium]